MTLANPVTILSFAAIFAGMSAGNASGDYLLAIMLVGGVFAGSCTWWLSLVSVTSIFRARFNAQALGWVNRVSGTIIGGFVIVVLFSLGGR